MKIKSRKERENEYNDLYGNVSFDVYDRLSDHLGDKFNDDLLTSALYRINDVKSKIKYNAIKFTFYEVPVQAHRPRVNYYTRGLHVPNAKANHDAVEKFVKKLHKDIKKIATPMRVEMNAYYPMPKNAKPLDVVLYETEHDYAIGKPDFDNVLKAYCDMLLTTILLDDDIVVSAEFNKYFSLKPRVEMIIIFTNGYSSEYTYNTIKNRKAFKNVSDYIDAQLICVPYKSKKGGKR